eukprot:SAG31_NODE_16378_length_711_cov_1.214052_2_plen_87_part_00
MSFGSQLICLLLAIGQTAKSTPAVRVYLPEVKLGLTAMQAVKALQDGNDVSGDLQIHTETVVLTIVVAQNVHDQLSQISGNTLMAA